MLLDEMFEGQGGMHAAKAYWNALTKLRTAWSEVFDEDLPTVGNRAKDAYEQAIARMKERLSVDAAGSTRLRAVLDVDEKQDIAQALLTDADMDDLSPKMVKDALLAQCVVLGAGRHELRALLRPVLDAVFPGAGTRRPRVGANRHWRRLLQYLRELENETTWPTGQGIRLMNAGGRGPVARVPSDPADLAIRIDPDHFRPRSLSPSD
jgi:hypothetical protein